MNLVETPTSTPQLTSGGPGGNAFISTGVEVADNTFAVPGASGCGLLGALDAALDLKVGLPSASGKNSALIDQDGEILAAQFLLPATPTPTATQTATATPTDTPTATDTPMATATATAIATLVATATATATRTATQTATPTATASPTAGKLTDQADLARVRSAGSGDNLCPKNVTLTNSNSSSLQIDTVTPSGDFSLSSDGCSGTDLGPSANCVVGVVFTPSQTGTRTGTLTIVDAASNSPQKVSLSGKGILVKPTFSPPQSDLRQPAGGGSQRREDYHADQSQSGFAERDQRVPSGDFTTVNDTCSQTEVPAAGTCTFGVIFTPSQKGTRTGKIIVTDNAVTPTQTITLSGVGIIVTPTVSPKSLTYGRVQVNTISPPQTVTLSNSNRVAVTFTSIATSGPLCHNHE